MWITTKQKTCGSLHIGEDDVAIVEVDHVQPRADDEGRLQVLVPVLPDNTTREDGQSWINKKTIRRDKPITIMYVFLIRNYNLVLFLRSSGIVMPSHIFKRSIYSL